MADDKGRTTIKMKYVGHFKSTEKLVQLPIPLVSNSQKIDKVLRFTRAADSHGPGFCEVPMEWAGALIDLGGNWQLNEKLTPELSRQIKDAQEACQAKMQKFINDNELVSA